MSNVHRVNPWHRRPFAHAVLFGALLPLVAAAGAGNVATDDGLAISIDARGRIDGVRIGTRDLPAKGVGGFLILDVAETEERAGANLVRNGDFSQGSEAWVSSAGREIVRGEAALYSKGNSAFVAAPPPNKVTKGMISQMVPVQPNTGYSFSADMKTERCSGAAAHLWLSQFGKDGKTGTEPMIVVQSAASDSQGSWFTVKHDFVTGPNTYRVQIRQGIYAGYGKVWLDDVRLVARRNLLKAAHPMTGVVTRTASGVRLDAAHESARLKLEAEVRSVPGRISIAGTLADTSGEDRCVMLWVLLPLELRAQWFFGYDIETALPITAGDGVLGNSQTFIAGQAMAQYPWSCVYDRDSGLALSVPMDQPRVCRLEYLPGAGYYVVFELGLSQATGKFPGKATFFCDLYRFAPEWGFRAAAKRYYGLFPRYFQRHPTAGDRSWGAYEIVDWAKQARPLDCGSCMASYSFHGNRNVLDDRASSKVTVRYIEPNGYWAWRLGHKPYPKSTPQLPYAELLADLEARAKQGKWMRAARRVQQTALADADGNLRVSSWSPGYGGAHWLCNPDPDLPDESGAIANQATDAWQDCIGHCEAYDLDGSYSDAGPGGFFRNFRRDHFRFVDHPLTFDPSTRNVCYLMPFHMFEFYRWFTERLHARNLCLLMHWSSCGYPTFVYGLNFADTIGNEQHGAAMSRNQYLTQRALAYQKPVQSYTYAAKVTDAMGRRYTVADLAYGVLSNNSRDPIVSRLYMGLQRELSAAGWEPVTMARPVSGTVNLERFGRLADANLHLTVRNATAEPQPAEIELSPDLLATAGSALWFHVVDHLYAASAPAEVQGRRLALRVEPGMARVVRIGTLAQIAAMPRAELVRQWEGARNFLALADGSAYPKRARAMLVGRPLALTAVVRRLRGTAMEHAAGGPWLRHTALALAEADFVDSMMRLLRNGLWASFSETWPVEPGYPLVLGPGMRASVPTHVLVNGRQRPAKLVSFLPQIKAGSDITIDDNAPEALYPMCLEWEESGVEDGSCRWYFDVQVRKTLEATVAPAKLPGNLASNLTVRLENLTIADIRGAVALVPSDGWQTRPGKVEVTIAGGQTAPVTFSLSAPSAAATSELALKIRFETASTTTEQSVKVPLIQTPCVTCARTTAPPQLDGKLNDPCWRGEPTIAGLRLRIPDPAGTKPTQKTRAWLRYDTNNLYVAVSCDEARMQDVKRTVINDNGPIWKDDCVELWLVPAHRREAAAQLIANLLNKHYSSGVLPTWATATATRDRGWSMEFTIPFSCLNQTTPEPGDVWGLNLGRAEKPHKETSAWSPPGFHDRASDGSVVFE